MSRGLCVSLDGRAGWVPVPRVGAPGWGLGAPLDTCLFTCLAWAWGQACPCARQSGSAHVLHSRGGGGWLCPPAPVLGRGPRCPAWPRDPEQKFNQALALGGDRPHP